MDPRPPAVAPPLPPGVLAAAAFPPGPVDLRLHLGATPPVDIDIGFGKGRSLADWAAATPAGTLVGVEIRLSSVRRAAERLERIGATRVRVVHGDFRALVPRLVPEGFVRRAFLHFPDPWWKKRHLKRQVVSGPVLAELARLLAPGGEVFVQTDVPERAEEFRAALGSAGLAEVSVTVGGENPFGIRSNREVRCEEAGLPVHRLWFRRAG